MTALKSPTVKDTVLQIPHKQEVFLFADSDLPKLYSLMCVQLHIFLILPMSTLCGLCFK